MLTSSVELALAGLLGAELNAEGAGRIESLPLDLPAGLSLSLVGLSVDLDALALGGPGFGDLSDRITVGL